MADTAQGSSSALTRFPVPPQKIACGFYHSIAISSNEQENRTEAWGWGKNQYNTLGLLPNERAPSARNKESPTVGTVDVDQPQPRVTALKSDVYEVACGANHSVFLKKKPDEPGGVLLASGLGNCGRVGMRNPVASPLETEEVEELWHTVSGPVRVQFKWASGTRVLRVTCGADHTMCYATDRRLYAWGSNLEGQCGVGTTRNVFSPTAIAFSESKAILHFAAGAMHSLAAAGESSELWCWGCGRNGRHGLGNKKAALSPSSVAATGDARIIFVAGGEAHSSAIDSDGQVFMWGAGSYGRLGNGDEGDSLVPKRIAFFTDSSVAIKSVALGGLHSLFLEAPNAETGRHPRVFTCGTGAALGLLSEGDRSVVRVPLPLTDKKITGRTICQIAAGMYHSLVLTTEGLLISWGVGTNGRLGCHECMDKTFCEASFVQLGNSTGMDRLFPAFYSQSQHFTDESERAVRNSSKPDALVKQTSLKRSADWELVQLSCGALHSAARTHGGQVYLWGCNTNGQLGLGESITYSWIPRAVSVGNRKIREIATGYEHCLAVTYTQELWAWGKGTDGQLGTGYARDEHEPQHIHGLSQVVTCAAGEVHSAAIVRPSTTSPGAFQLQTWGSADSGILGISSDYMSGTLSSPMPVDFPGLGGSAGSAATSAGAANSGALVPRPKQLSRSGGGPSGGQAAAAGLEAVGPVQVRCGPNHTAVIVGRCHLLGANGQADFVQQVWTFGGGWYGRLGLERIDEARGVKIPQEGTTSNVYSPRQVNLHGVSARDVACGAYHTCMVSHTDELYVWGRKGEVCEPAEDLRLPKKFAHLGGQTKVKLVACGDLHTLAVTTAGEVFVWGDNRMGQLGRGIIGRDEIRIPTVAKMPPGAVEMLATGAGHTIAQFVNGDTYAWGNQSCGRLGLQDKLQDKIVYSPMKVSAVWCSIESRSTNAVPRQRKVVVPTDTASMTESHHSALECGEDSADHLQSSDQISELLHTQKVTEISTMQSLLKQEDKAHQEEALMKRYEQLRRSLEEIRRVIKELPIKEQELDRMEADFDQSLLTNLRWFKVSRPELDDQRIDPSFIGRLPVYAELLWALQQQTSYLAQLSTCIYPDEEPVFYSTIWAIFADKSGRSRNLFLTLLRLMIEKETEASVSKSIEDIFNPSKSKAFRMISDYAVCRVHYKDVVNAYLKDEQIGRMPTLLQALRGTSERSECFALTFQDFRESCDEDLKKKEDQDLKAAFASSLEKFREFLLDPFLKAIVYVDLPFDIRQILCHTLQAVNNRQFATKEDASIPAELRKCEPLLRLFCYGILGPLLRNPTRFASRECFLERSAEILKEGDTLMVSNMNAIADLLEHMIEGKLQAKQNIMKSATRVLKPELLKYLKKQSEVPNDLETELMIDTYNMHFDRSKHTVSMMSADLMKLSNILKQHMAKLRIRENDELEMLCNMLSEWSSDKITGVERLQGTNVLHNFNMDPRFMLHDEEVVLCGVSNCLMPARLCGSLVSKVFITPYTASDDGENPRRVLETLFRQLEPVKSKNFKDMRDEFEKLRGEERLKDPPNYEMMQLLSKGLRMVGEMLNVEASPQDLLQIMADQLVARAKYSQYLWNIEKGLSRIKAQRELYAARLDEWRVELETALSASVSLKLPEPFHKQSGSQFFAFSAIGRKLEARRNTGVADPGQMRQIGCSYLPFETYWVSKLKSTGVLVMVHPPFSTMQNKMKITIRALANGGVELVVNVVQGKHQTLVKTLNISEERLVELKHAAKDEHAMLGNVNEDPFLTCVSSAFMQLVTKLRENNR